MYTHTYNMSMLLCLSSYAVNCLKLECAILRRASGPRPARLGCTIYIYIHMYIHIYIYIYRERERRTYIYIYICI